MFLSLADYLKSYFHAFHVFQYLTLRIMLATGSALLISLLFGPILIAKLQMYKIQQVVRQDGPISHLQKTGTPTMGGLLILIGISSSVLLWANLSNAYIWIALLTTLGFGLVGGVDDYLKLSLQNPRGLPSRWKFFWQSIIALIVVVYLYQSHPMDARIVIPFVKNWQLSLGILFVPFAYLVLVGASNAVNLTDGLDGLAIVPVVLIAAAFAIFAYVSGRADFADYLCLPYLPGIQELCIFCGAIVGAGLGFLWFNAFPAEIFMGDVGALSLGAALAIVAILLRQELILFIMGGVFVMETCSVVIQVLVFRRTGKRFFRMAPIHHHFELGGWSEPKVIVRFWIMTVIMVLIGLSSLKIR